MAFNCLQLKQAKPSKWYVSNMPQITLSVLSHITRIDHKLWNKQITVVSCKTITNGKQNIGWNLVPCRKFCCDWFSKYSSNTAFVAWYQSNLQQNHM